MLDTAHMRTQDIGEIGGMPLFTGGSSIHAKTAPSLHDIVVPPTPPKAAPPVAQHADAQPTKYFYGVNLCIGVK